jgi:hypothetical protein
MKNAQTVGWLKGELLPSFSSLPPVRRRARSAPVRRRNSTSLNGSFAMANALNLSAPLHQAVGEAMDTYSHVEAHLAEIVGNLLKVNYRKSHMIFFAISSMPSRLDLIEGLFLLHLKGQHLPDFKKYWASVQKYLRKVTLFKECARSLAPPNQHLHQ